MSAKTLFLAAAFAVTATCASAANLDISKPEDALTAYRKVQCSTKDSVPAVYHWSGRAYSRVNGEPDRLLFRLEGMNVRQCVTVTDPVRGKGFKMVSRELMFYLDPKTGEVLKTWNNPWTGKSVDVMHVANDPVNMRGAMFPIDEKGEPFKLDVRVDAGRVFMPAEVPLFYRNPLAGDYQDYIGGQYHAMEIFDFIMDEKTLLDAKTTNARSSVAWVRLAQWLPWMKMGSRDGMLVFNATGQMISGIDALPAVIKTEIANNYPEYNAPPPVDDTRPNETSWTYFKKQVEKKAAAR